MENIYIYIYWCRAWGVNRCERQWWGVTALIRCCFPQSVLEVCPNPVIMAQQLCHIELVIITKSVSHFSPVENCNNLWNTVTVDRFILGNLFQCTNKLLHSITGKTCKYWTRGVCANFYSKRWSGLKSKIDQLVWEAVYLFSFYCVNKIFFSFSFFLSFRSLFVPFVRAFSHSFPWFINFFPLSVNSQLYQKDKQLRSLHWMVQSTWLFSGNWSLFGKYKIPMNWVWSYRTGKYLALGHTDLVVFGLFSRPVLRLSQ